jgi:hypothetical protein
MGTMGAAGAAAGAEGGVPPSIPAVTEYPLGTEGALPGDLPLDDSRTEGYFSQWSANVVIEMPLKLQV